jgi:VanZ family protein
LKSAFYKFIPAIIWFLISLWLLTLPGEKIPHIDWFDTLQVDKLVHITLFFILCFLFMWAIKQTVTNATNKIIWFTCIALFGILYGVAIEFIQRDYIPNRSFDIWDIAADTVGSIAAFIWCFKKWKK